MSQQQRIHHQPGPQLPKHKRRYLRNAIPPAARHVKGWRYFAGLFGGEHIAATEFVIGVTFVTMGVGTKELLLGLLIGNLLAVASWMIVTTPIAVETRRSLFSYLEQITGSHFSKIYNSAILLFYGSLAAAMITVSAYAVRFALDLPVQLEAYPTSIAFIIVTLLLSAVVVIVAARGFEAMANFATICSPWMLTCFICGAAIALPTLAMHVHGSTEVSSFSDFLSVARDSIWTGTTPEGKPGISTWEVAAFAWANGAMVHLGLIDMATFRFAHRKWYGVFSSIGMFLGHYIGWISAGLMGAGAAVLVGKSLINLDSADVAFATLGYVGLLAVICAGWTTANACLYRAGLAASALMPSMTRSKVTAIIGIVIAAAACFPFVAQSVMPLTVYGAILLSPVGAITIAEHYLLPKLGLTRYWSRYLGQKLNLAALLAWGIALAFAVTMVVTKAISFYYIFLPEYLIALILYPIAASFMGAKDSWPTHEMRQEEKEQVLINFEQKRLAENANSDDEEEDPSDAHTANIAKVLLVGAGAILIFMVVLAVRLVCLAPSGEALKTMQQDYFYTAIALTFAYFVIAFCAMRVTDGPSDEEEESTPQTTQDTAQQPLSSAPSTNSPQS
ncbi:hypothetical protein [Vibrio nitrifigilis]|uniref:Nucleoside transporter n=1 Tax=Vibrio nitrifigilis TaxID=2789781 RepID=A0ABS0GBC4_9VIBR|nr:hypothetical protein [Vibrio nitrifigilis]MBF8999709.1 hypothetical protein [Vibrio nitrifigilis]